MSVRRLSEITAPGTISEGSPLDLDLFDLQAGDDITLLLTDIATEYDAVYVRAPSKTVSIACATATFTGIPFVFLEDESSLNKLTIQHTTATSAYLMLDILNPPIVKIGGPNLSMTFRGTHPGLGTGPGGAEDLALVRVGLNNLTTPDLAEIRANFHHTRCYGVYFFGGDSGLLNRFRLVRLAGLYFSASAVVQSGVDELWLDPDRTVVMDPWCRVQGWDGGIAKTESGVQIGCFDSQREEPRTGPVMASQYTSRISGGVTFEYGTPNANLLVPRYIGNGETDPYIVRYRDFGSSGPSEMTGMVGSGVMVKKGPDFGIMKSDPAWAYDFTAATGRFIRFHELPSQYGCGTYSGRIAAGLAAPGNTTDNDYHSGNPFFWRAEASSDNQGVPFETAYFNAAFQGMSSWRLRDETITDVDTTGALDSFGYGTDRSWGHVLVAASGTRMKGTTNILDTNTVTGPGSWNRIGIAPWVTQQADTINPVDNVITNTRCHGVVIVGANASGTVISNVDFSGDAAREILTIGTGSTVALSDLTVRSGSTITRTGTGAATYDGTPLTFTADIYTFGALTDATVTGNGVPNPPSGGGVS